MIFVDKCILFNIVILYALITKLGILDKNRKRFTPNQIFMHLH